METFFWNSPWPAKSLKTIKTFWRNFWGVPVILDHRLTRLWILWITTSEKIFEGNHRYRPKPKIWPNSRKSANDNLTHGTIDRTVKEFSKRQNTCVVAKRQPGRTGQPGNLAFATWAGCSSARCKESCLTGSDRFWPIVRSKLLQRPAVARQRATLRRYIRTPAVRSLYGWTWLHLNASKTEVMLPGSNQQLQRFWYTSPADLCNILVVLCFWWYKHEIWYTVIAYP